MTTLKYVQDNQDLTDDGYRLSQEFDAFVNAAAEADYRTEDGEPLEQVFDDFWQLANGRAPDSIYDELPSDKCETVREACLTLLAPKGAIASWQRDELRDALLTLSKRQLFDALLRYGEAVNEYYRLRWIVAERGGWRKDAPDAAPALAPPSAPC